VRLHDSFLGICVPGPSRSPPLRFCIQPVAYVHPNQHAADTHTDANGHIRHAHIDPDGNHPDVHANHSAAHVRHDGVDLFERCLRPSFRQRGHELRSEHPHQRRLRGTEWRAPRIHRSRRQSSTWADDAEDLRVLRNRHRGHTEPERDLHLHDSGHGWRGRHSAAGLYHHGYVSSSTPVTLTATLASVVGWSEHEVFNVTSDVTRDRRVVLDPVLQMEVILKEGVDLVLVAVRPVGMFSTLVSARKARVPPQDSLPLLNPPHRLSSDSCSK
jgi:hypothetical protein